MIITIDGPAGVGKTTAARLVADTLGFNYFDTGAMYRALTYKVLQENVQITNPLALQHCLEEFHFRIVSQEGTKHYFVGAEDVSEVIRSPKITEAVSSISAHAAVRKHLFAIQRAFGTGQNAVFEGRDMGTVVFPHAEVKIYLTASLEMRTQRRYLEPLHASNMTQQEVLHSLEKRDLLDSSRELSPLMPAADAVIIDTSTLTIEQVVCRILEEISKKR